MSSLIPVTRVVSRQPYDTQKAFVNAGSIITIVDAGQGFSCIRIQGATDHQEWTVAHDVDEMERKIAKAIPNFELSRNS